MRYLTTLLSIFLIVFAGQSASAQEWTTGARPVTWTTSAVVGDGVDRHAEVSTSEQGGDPPALDYEPAAIDEGENYTRSEWLGTPNLPGDRQDQGEAKFRLTCNEGFFGSADPIIAYGLPSPHHHTFIGNFGVFEDGGIEAVRTADYTDLREHPASSCTGGPLNGTLYWEPTLFYEIQEGLFIPVRPNAVSFYYTLHYADVAKKYRLLRGLSFIGGVDPADRLNTSRLAEIPDGQGWMKQSGSSNTHRRYNGWSGWGCYNGATVIPLAVGNTADAGNSPYFARQLVNNDGTDPWDGNCENPAYKLIANNVAPACWDGHNLTSPNGRDHFRYAITRTQAQSTWFCPDGWWQVPTFEVKTEFMNGWGGVSGHAFRSKLHLSSDRMDPDPENWQPRGSTFHFDWMNGWDSVVQHTWQKFCTGTDQDGDEGDPLTCNDSTISDTEKLITTSASPDPTLSHDPVLSFHTYHDDTAVEAFGPIEDGTTVPGGVATHTH
jgi:hypothetical protein